MIIEITPALTISEGTLEKKITEVQTLIDALKLTADPLNKRIANAQHVHRFLVEALVAVRQARKATESVIGDEIPF